MAIPHEDSVTVSVQAPPEVIYDLITDVTRMGEWSPECRRCEWVAPATAAAAGAEFRGHNKNGPLRWTTTSRVGVADRPRTFSFSTWLKGQEGTRWTYELRAAGDGDGGATELTESYLAVSEPWYLRVADSLMPRRSQLRRGMQQTLERIKAVAEGSTP